LDHATGWLNSPPLTRDDLCGRVVVYDFWTYTCINWLRTLPYLRAWANRYSGHGLILIGIHTPEFGFERDIKNVSQAVLELDVDYPVVVDSDYAIWHAFSNEYWPALYVADGAGVIRYYRFGEGAYEESERGIQQLLKATGVRDVAGGHVDVSPVGVEVAADWDHLGSPETYLGLARGEGFAGRHREDGSYVIPDALRPNQWGLGGAWTRQSDRALLEEGDGKIAYRFSARDVNLILASRNADIPFEVRIDGQPPKSSHGVDCDEQGHGVLSRPRLYQLIRQREGVVDRTFEITFDAQGVAAYAFTFG
jgi:thiol-disulfide isomerase/thioredoxin